MSVTSSCTLVLGEERLDPRCLVRQEVVGDHMDRLAVGLVHHEVGQNLDALGRGLPRRGLTQTPRLSWC